MCGPRTHFIKVQISQSPSEHIIFFSLTEIIFAVRSIIKSFFRRRFGLLCWFLLRRRFGLLCWFLLRWRFCFHWHFCLRRRFLVCTRRRTAFLQAWRRPRRTLRRGFTWWFRHTFENQGLGFSICNGIWTHFFSFIYSIILIILESMNLEYSWI